MGGEMALEEVLVPEIVGIEEADERRLDGGEPGTRGAGLPDVLCSRISLKRGSASASSVCWMTAAELSVEASSTITQSRSRKLWRATERIASPI
jgi:hypothetical protein